MPSLDDRERMVGHVLRELDSGAYKKTLFVINFETHTILGYPGSIQSTKDLNDEEPVLQIKSQWITKVHSATTRPRVLHCLEIALPTGSQYFSVDSDEERDEWIESIRRCSMGQGSSGKAVMAAIQTKKEVAYQTVLVGGKVQRIPIQSNGSPVPGTALDRSGSQGMGRRTRGFPRVILAGHGIKLGAVMKNWKKRFFVLTEVSLGYYKTIEEVEPIRSISVGDMTTCSRSKAIAGKEHMFELVTPSRTYYIQVETEEEMVEWVQAFKTLISTVRGSSHQPPPMNSTPTSQDSADPPGPEGTLV